MVIIFSSARSVYLLELHWNITAVDAIKVSILLAILSKHNKNKTLKSIKILERYINTKQALHKQTNSNITRPNVKRIFGLVFVDIHASWSKSFRNETHLNARDLDIPCVRDSVFRNIDPANIKTKVTQCVAICYKKHK